MIGVEMLWLRCVITLWADVWFDYWSHKCHQWTLEFEVKSCFICQVSIFNGWCVSCRHPLLSNRKSSVWWSYILPFFCRLSSLGTTLVFCFCFCFLMLHKIQLKVESVGFRFIQSMDLYSFYLYCTCIYIIFVSQWCVVRTSLCFPKPITEFLINIKAVKWLISGHMCQLCSVLNSGWFKLLPVSVSPWCLGEEAAEMLCVLKKATKECLCGRDASFFWLPFNEARIVTQFLKWGTLILMWESQMEAVWLRFRSGHSCVLFIVWIGISHHFLLFQSVFDGRVSVCLPSEKHLLYCIHEFAIAAIFSNYLTEQLKTEKHKEND